MRPEAEAYVRQNILPAWMDLKHELANKAYRPTPKSEELLTKISGAVEDMPSVMVHELAQDEQDRLGPATINLNIEWWMDELLKEQNLTGHGYYAERKVKAFYDALDGKKMATHLEQAAISAYAERENEGK